MYLTDQQISARLSELLFESDDAEDPFDADLQIGACSVDLRLSRVYWLPVRRKPWPSRKASTIDLGRGRLMELSPARGWRRVDAGTHASITVRPGEVVLGRTAERFHIPNDCAAAIEGRSSFARLGLSVHADGSFINPGYTGRMPLTIYNESPFAIKIPVGAPLCQVMLIPLAEVPKAHYGHRNPKYMEDYGGPSYWWRDAIMRRIHDRHAKVHLEPRVFDELEALFSIDEPDLDLYLRLEAFLENRGTATYGTADEILSAFSKSERKQEFVSRAVVYGARAGFATAFGVSAPYWIFASHRATPLVVSSLLVCAVLGLAMLWGFYKRVPEFLTPHRLGKLRSKAARDIGETAA